MRAKFQEGEIVCVKTTGERVIVLDLPGDDADFYDVRRPVIFNSGEIKHEETSFLEFELETLEDHIERQIAEQRLIAKGKDRLNVCQDIQIAGEDQAKVLDVLPFRKPN